MLLTFHSLAGAAIASQVPNPLISWPLAFLSHFVLDCMPHWDFFTDGVRLPKKVKAAIALDFGLGLMFGLLFAIKSPVNSFNIIGACFFANFPDGLSAAWMFLGYRPWLVDLNLKIQSKLNFKSPLPWGMGVPVLAAGVSLYFLLR